MRILVAALVSTVALAACSRGQQQATPPATVACDRSCLEQQIESVLTGMVAHDASKLALNSGFRYIENNQSLKAGDGSWQTLQSVGPYKHYFADPDSGNAAVITTMKENDAEGLMTLRIKVVNGKLSEAESIITHDPRGAANYAKLGTGPAAEWLEAAPPEQRMTREALAATADKYFGSMQNNDGKGDYSFFADDCNRLEHGLKTTNNAPQNYGHSTDTEFVTLSCRGQFETGFLGFVTRIRDRRYEVIDVERGAVFGIAPFDHNGTLRNIPLTNGKNFKVPSYFSASRTLQVGEAFRARNGKIEDIEMTLHEFPYGMRTALRSTFSPTMAAPGGQAPAGSQACDRSCLEGVVGKLLTAFTSHDAKLAPLADKVKYTENDQQLALDDGLWGTLTAVSNYRIHVADPSRGQVSFVGRVTETDLPGILALRLRVVGGRISEIEAVIAREERPGSDELFRPRQPVEGDPAALTRLDPLFARVVPPPQRVGREQLVALVNRYFDAIQKGKGGDVPFASDCSRRESGVVVTGNKSLPRPPPKGRSATETTWGTTEQPFKPYALDCAAQLNSGYTAYVARVRDRRINVVDEQRGLVYAVAYYDIPGTVKSFDRKDGGPTVLPQVLGRPYTIASPQVFKIDGGQIHRVEALNKVMPYGTASGWEG